MYSKIRKLDEEGSSSDDSSSSKKKLTVGKVLSNMYRNTYYNKIVKYIKTQLGTIETEAPIPPPCSHQLHEFQSISTMNTTDFEILSNMWNYLLQIEIEQTTPLWPAAIEFPIPIDATVSRVDAEYVYWPN